MGYRWIFSERNARAAAERYRPSGLDATSSQVLELVRSHGISAETVLEIGGGIGSLHAIEWSAG